MNTLEYFVIICISRVLSYESGYKWEHFENQLLFILAGVAVTAMC